MTVLWLWMVACESRQVDEGLSVEQITKLVRPDAPDRGEWAAAVRSALVDIRLTPDASHACQVLAIVEQESGYNADPPVPGLSKVVREGVEQKFEKLGPLAKPVRAAVLSPIPEGGSLSFDEQLSRVRTEQDVDQLFRAILDHHERSAPEVANVLHTLFPKKIDSFNPVETAGSMQVSVSWSQQLGRREGLSAEEVRDMLYTRYGGVKYGTARLFAHETERREEARGCIGPLPDLPSTYEDPIFRFADYNAGLYTSRNANLQEQLKRLINEPITADGDLLQWNDSGKPKGDQDGQTVRALETWRLRYAPDLGRAQMLDDLEQEKSITFEQTETWRRVRESYRERFGKEAAYARLPEVSLDSPKLRRDLTTEWFATNVKRRYDACMARAPISR